ncbi:MAG: EAL domain-containing protein [Bauldia sp.]|nr:EAL domain-containing protein [Bauldia sp.]
MARSLASALLVAVLALGAWFGGILLPVDAFLGDLRFKLGQRQPTGELLLVDIDAKSLAEIGAWPWPRGIHAQVIDRLVEYGAWETALDIDFSTSSTPEQDQALESALRRASGAVILPIFQQQASADGDAVTYSRPIERFAAVSWGATVNVRPDPDGQVRAFAFGQWIDGEPVLSLPAVMSGSVGNVGEEFLIDYGIRADQIDRVSVIDLLEGRVAPERVKGRTVIVGASAIELRDLFQVPNYGLISGHTLNAVALETLLQDRALVRVSTEVLIAGLVLIGLIFVALLGRFPWTQILGVAVLMAAGTEIAAMLLQISKAVALPTSLWHAAFFGFALLSIVKEIDFGRVTLAVSKAETRNTEALLKRVIEDNFAGVIIVGEDGNIGLASTTASALLKVENNSRLVGRRYADVLPAALAEEMRVSIDRFRRGVWRRQPPAELVIENRDGTKTIFEYTVTPSRLGEAQSDGRRALPNRVSACLTFMDVTVEREAEARVEYMARFDMLTGLANRNQFIEVLTDRLQDRRHQKHDLPAVICFDLDRFKNVNDTLGHHYGDVLLRAVAARVREVVGTDELVARFGGDEFAILLSGRSRGELGAVADRIIIALREPFDLEGHRLIIGASVGIAIASETTDPAVLTKNADIALYRAKSAGGAIYRFFDPGMNDGLAHRQQLELELWEAFRKGQFEVYYQPQMNIETGRMVGVEALVRWNHPKRGVVMPGDFITVAEAIGLIDPLGVWIMQRACEEVARWPLPVRLAVNISPAQFTRGDLVASVRETLDASGLPPSQLQLEITESLFLQENAVINSVTSQLKDMGVQFALDDFGTGYSSLAYVARFPISKIKIDKTFVTGVPNVRGSVAIVRAVTAMAQGLDIEVNAEGVETADQLRTLRLLGVNEAQGHLFGMAQPAAMIRAELAAQAGTLRVVGGKGGFAA